VKNLRTRRRHTRLAGTGATGAQPRSTASGHVLTPPRAPAPGPSAPRPAGAPGRTQIIRPLARSVALLVPAGQILALLWAIWTRTLQVPWWDEWATVGLVEHANQGTLTAHDLWVPHFHSHRIVIPRLVDLALIELTRWNRQIEMTFDLAVAVAAGLLIFWCLRRTLRSLDAALALVVPLSLLLLSFSQYADWFLPFQLQNIGTTFGAALCLWALAPPPAPRRGGWRAVGLAIVGASIATLCSAAGLMAWVAFIPSVARTGYRKLVLWAGVGAGMWAAYLYGFPSQGRFPPLTDAAKFVLGLLGAPLGYPSLRRSEVFGLAGLLLLAAATGAIAVLWRRGADVRAALIWLDLALFALLAALLTADGRSAGSVGLGITSRYQFLGALWWVALFALGGWIAQRLAPGLLARGRSIRERWAAQRAPLAAAGAIAAAMVLACAGCIVVNAIGLREGLAWQDGLRQHQGCIVHYATAPDACLGLFFPIQDKQTNLGYAAYLRQHHLSIFAGARQP
jgi:hypothetical protein